MSITQAKQAEKAYKKASLNVAETSSNTRSTPYYVEPASPTQVFASNIIADDESIPATAPTSGLVDGTMWDSTGAVTTDPTKAIIQYNEVTMPTVLGSGNNAYYIASIPGIILPFNYGDGSYSAKIFANTVAGSSIPFGQNSWEFDTAAGVIVFFDGKPPSVTANTIGIKYWTYVGRTGVGTVNTVSGETKTYVLNTLLAPEGAVWNPGTETWTITHELDTNDLVIETYLNNTLELVSPDSIVLTSVDVLELTVPGILDKSTGITSYPVIKLIIKS